MSTLGAGGLFAGSMGPPQSSRALILRTRAYGESDRIVSFLTEDFGKLTGIAKGARNSRRRFANCLNPFTLVRVHFRQRAGATMVFMDSCDLLSLPGNLCEPVKFAYASYLVELVDFLTVEGNPSHEAFALLGGALESLRDGPATAGFLRSFELHLLAEAGFAPRLGECDTCARPLAQGAPAHFDRSSGALLCGACGGDRDGLVTVSADALASLFQFLDVPPETARAIRIAPAVRAETAALLSDWLALHLPRPLKSVGLIAALAG